MTRENTDPRSPLPTAAQCDADVAREDAAFATVRALIAQAVSTPESEGIAVGTVVLRPAQVETLNRVRVALSEFGGAVLADAPGLGKTYIALAAASALAKAPTGTRASCSTLVAAPSALRSMWGVAAQRAGVRISFVSLEQLSLGAQPANARFVIVDEAHHAANPQTKRYRALSAICAGAHVLLLSATPIRNHTDELNALLALVLGPRSARLDAAERARVVLRREASADDRPGIAPTRWRPAPAGPDWSRKITALPPPVPARDGRVARQLVSSGLARAWASSAAAFDEALRKRIARGEALEQALAAGRVPTRQELRAWTVGDDAVQLAFPGIVTAHTAVMVEAAPRLQLTAVRAHLDAVRALRAAARAHIAVDTSARAALLQRLVARHRGQRVVAFTSFAATALALWRELRHTPGVALLTGRGARTASGDRSRNELLAVLGGTLSVPAHNDICLAIASDVVSEGVNLAGVSVVVHLDSPWTPAALEQRAGRAARMGATHRVVHVYGVRAPTAARRLLRLDGILRTKRRAHARFAGDAAASTALRAHVRHWASSSASHVNTPTPSGEPVLAAAYARRAGFVAVLCQREQLSLHSSAGASPGKILAMLRSARNEPAPLPYPMAQRALSQLSKHIGTIETRPLVGADAPSSRARAALLRRVDALIAGAPASARASLAAAACTLRAALNAAAGAGVETEARTLASRPAASASAWMEQASQRLNALVRPGRNTGAPESSSAAPVRVVALLLLVRDDRPTPPSARQLPAHPPAPRAAST